MLSLATSIIHRLIYLSSTFSLFPTAWSRVRSCRIKGIIRRGWTAERAARERVMGTELVLYQGPGEPAPEAGRLPEIIRVAGQAAMDAAEDFFEGAISNDNTRRAYRHA